MTVCMHSCALNNCRLDLCFPVLISPADEEAKLRPPVKFATESSVDFQLQNAR